MQPVVEAQDVLVFHVRDEAVTEGRHDVFAQHEAAMRHGCRLPAIAFEVLDNNVPLTLPRSRCRRPFPDAKGGSMKVPPTSTPMRQGAGELLMIARFRPPATELPSGT